MQGFTLYFGRAKALRYFCLSIDFEISLKIHNMNGKANCIRELGQIRINELSAPPLNYIISPPQSCLRNIFQGRISILSSVSRGCGSKDTNMHLRGE